MPIYFTYILWSEITRHYYIGSCEDIQNRLSRHNRGAVRSTKLGIPWTLIRTEEFKSRQDAYRRERQLK
ncbi:MAG: GIY-YIG nuclease family protein [bacterium]|nr:GIY-YIG nuclease family protein [bacterium]